MIRLFTSHYPEKCASRLGDLRTCLNRNLANPVVDAVCLLLEGVEMPCPEEARLQVRVVSDRPKYQDFFDWANELCSSADDAVVIANSDIYLDQSIRALVQTLKANQCAALARWDVTANNSVSLFDRNDSQDVWVFKGKIRPVVSNYLMGVPRCDNRLLYELRAAGYEVINPAFSVRAHHLHNGERGEYPGEIQGLHVDPPYNYLWPHNLRSLPATSLHNLRYPDSKLGWRIDWRKLQRTLPWRAADKLRRLVARSER